MDFSVNEVEYCKVKVNAEAGLQKINDKRTEVLAEFKNVNVSGFRPGKASLDVIKVRYKKQIENRLREALAEDAVFGVMNDKNLKPLGMPEFSTVNLTDSKFSCEFLLKVKPTVQLKTYKEFEFAKPTELMPVGVFAEKILQDLCERNGEASPFGEDDFVQISDSILLDYEGSLDGVVREDLSAKKELVQVGKSPLPGFDNNLLGMKMGDVREFDYITPDNVAEQYKGKTIHFKVECCMGSRTVPAVLDDDLAKRMNFQDLSALRIHVAQIALQRIQEQQNSMIGNQLAHRLVDEHEIIIPDWLLSSEAQMKAKVNKVDWEKLSDSEKEKYLSDAMKTVKLSLILEKIREVELEAQLSDAEAVGMIKYQLAKMQAGQNQAQDVEKAFEELQKNGGVPILMGRVRDEHTLNFLIHTCKIVEQEKVQTS